MMTPTECADGCPTRQPRDDVQFGCNFTTVFECVECHRLFAQDAVAC